ncbi:MAG: hypothetical protein RLZ10_706 [Bacteroidota bacterium]|jgi:hypothetical protein
MKKDINEINENPPLSKSTYDHIVLRDKGNGCLILTSGGEYRTDFYELVYQSDNSDDAKDYYMKMRYDNNK